MDSAKLLKAPIDPDFQPESFSRILLDGPCSGLGSRPRFVEPMIMVDLTNAADYQRRLLDSAYGLLEYNGILVYSTCTINPQENEENVAYMLNKYPDMHLVQQSPTIGDHGLPGCGLDDQQCSLVQRFDPSSASDTIGFFIAKFQKFK
eukprot:gene1435-1664_t